MDPLFSTELIFLILGVVGFNGYLLVSVFDPLPPQKNHFLSMVPPLGGNFSSVRGIRVIMLHRPKGEQRSNRNRWERKKEKFKIRSRAPPPGAAENNSYRK